MMDRKKHRPGNADDISAAPETQTEEDALAVEDTEEARMLEKLIGEKEQAERERDEYLDLLQRARAEFDNYRMRNKNAREDARCEAVQDTICKILPVLDNLERAAESQGGEEALRGGLQLVLKQLHTLLASAGVEEITAEGETFDPNLHHAVMQEPIDGVESGSVAFVLQKGFRMGDKVLRPCMVKVAE
jgi:molecular chaperone GrpE